MLSESFRFTQAAAGFAAALLLALPARAADAPATGSTLESGGLKPPTAIDKNDAPPPNQTEQQLDRADKADSGRGLEFVWLNVEGGGETLGLQTFRARDLVDGSVIHTKQTGLVYGAGLGVRLLVFTLGARFRMGSFPDYRLWTLNLEGGMHVPLGRIEPYFTLGAGYASLGPFDAGGPLGAGLKSAGINARGLDVRASAGVDFYLTDTFSVGGNLAGDALFLSRQKSDASKLGLTQQQQSPASAVYSSDGSGIGMGGALTLVVGFHF